jgi:hypothetical protein
VGVGNNRIGTERLNVQEGRPDSLSAETDKLVFKTATDRSIEAANRIEEEIGVCRRLAPQTVFILGFARSATTIATQIVNSSPDALILGESNWYIQKEGARFRDWYNAMHLIFENQVSKTTYAPDFIPYADHTWWEWIQAASSFYSILGDKMAFSAYHFSVAKPDKILAFFEARFFTSRYVFTIREPVQTLLSVARLFSIQDDYRMTAEIKAWLKFVQLWADWIRIFPNTLTLLADFGSDGLADLRQFLDLELKGAEKLLNPEEQRQHQTITDFPILALIEYELTTIFATMREALSVDRVNWQADQKRVLCLNDTRADESASIRLAPHPVGQAWVLAENMLRKLERHAPSANHERTDKSEPAGAIATISAPRDETLTCVGGPRA